MDAKSTVPKQKADLTKTSILDQPGHKEPRIDQPMPELLGKCSETRKYDGYDLWVLKKQLALLRAISSKGFFLCIIA
jgi:hypothetical protein